MLKKGTPEEVKAVKEDKVGGRVALNQTLTAVSRTSKRNWGGAAPHGPTGVDHSPSIFHNFCGAGRLDISLKWLFKPRLKRNGRPGFGETRDSHKSSGDQDRSERLALHALTAILLLLG